MTNHICKTCGGALTLLSGSTWVCSYCKNTYEEESVKKNTDMMRELLDAHKAEQVSNLRRSLYDAITARYIDSTAICTVCSEIKKLLPDDFMANFYYTANHGTPHEVSTAIREIDAREQIEYVEGIVNHMVKSMRSEYVLPLQNLVERAYKNVNMLKFEELSTKISDESVKVNAGMYETAVPRDVFVAYSSKDMGRVEELVEFLESNGLDCFVAVRNLRHGRGAVQNYEKALHEAMENCRFVVFVSSQNSRSMECDALKVELKYIKNNDILNAPAEYRKNYITMPQRYKMNRIEYRIDNQRTQPYAEKVVTEFFAGLEFAYSPEEVIDRIYNYEDIPEETPPPAKKVEKTVSAPAAEKYCTMCGTKNIDIAKFCAECGNDKFVNTYTEYELYKQLRKNQEELEAAKKREEEAAKARAAEEARRRAKEEEELRQMRAKIEREKRELEEMKKKAATYNSTPSNNYYSAPKKFKVNSIQLFSYDGSSFNAPKVYGGTQYKNDVRYMGVLLTYDKVNVNTSITINWQIFKSDGSAYTNPISSTATVQAGSHDFFHAWGWANPGNWPVGRYKVVASLNDSDKVSAEFEIKSGGFADYRPYISSVKTFEGGNQAPEENSRYYTSYFNQSNTRSVYFHFNFTQVKYNTLTTINYKIYRPNGSVMTNTRTPILMQSGWDRCWTGYGWSTYGNWPKGQYRYEVSIGNSSPVSGTFNIT